MLYGSCQQSKQRTSIRTFLWTKLFRKLVMFNNKLTITCLVCYTGLWHAMWDICSPWNYASTCIHNAHYLPCLNVHQYLICQLAMKDPCFRIFSSSLWWSWSWFLSYCNAQMDILCYTITPCKLVTHVFSSCHSLFPCNYVVIIQVCPPSYKNKKVTLLMHHPSSMLYFQ